MENINGPEMVTKKRPKVLVWSLVIAIVIVMNMFFNYTISLIYKEPVYQNYCPDIIYNKAYDTKDSCVAVGGAWSETVSPVTSPKVTSPVKTQIAGYCNQTYTCQKTFNDTENVYKRNVFIVLIILGVLIIIAGAYAGVPLLSVAFSWSGVLSLVIASVRYWGSADSLIRVIILAISLASLIWLAVKKFNK